MRTQGLIAVAVAALVLLLSGPMAQAGWHGTPAPAMVGGPWHGDVRAGGPGIPTPGLILFGFIFVGLVLAVFALLRSSNSAPSTDPDEEPLRILKRRLARGEITREEYEAVREVLA
jgi:putative membrane protein